MKIRIHNPIYGVPITYLGQHCSDQFEICGLTSGSIEVSGSSYLGTIDTIKYDGGKGRAYISSGKSVYTRIIIKQK